ncbi:hypothetical protein [Lacinutrix jangbogonensis]|uniref:hypothetical protein n=1 Tax=Lacinutrix jangbogonensis TaxID=1469557 RepID=UPI00053DE1D5|nr:hypothetical protein [Lacinutrix jangbogonensis]
MFKLDVKDYNIPLPKKGLFVSITPVNSNNKKPKSLMYVIAPVLKWTYAVKALTYKSFRGKPWRLSKTKYKSKKPFSKTKICFSNPMLTLNVKFIKE